MSKVSYVAAVGEVSIVLSACFGIVYPGEKHGRQKMIGAALITLGVVAISLSRSWFPCRETGYKIVHYPVHRTGYAAEGFHKLLSKI